MSPEKVAPTDDRENQVWSAIAVFEQIVQTIPNDRVSLEALSHAYEQVGDHTRAREYLVRLANVLVDEQDREAAETVQERLKRFAAADESAAEAELRIEQFLTASVGSGTPASTTVAVAPTPRPADPQVATEILKRGVPVAAELSFAWNLFQAGELDQEEYAAVAQDLTELSASDKPVTVSVLHVLHDRASRRLDRVMLYTSRTCGAAILPLASFDPQHDAFTLVPLDFMVRQGLVVFDLLGRDALVGILNPFNLDLRRDVETLTGRRCHFYLAPPGEFDALLETIRSRIAAAAEPGAVPTP
jgi:hypothetical protein